MGKYNDEDKNFYLRYSSFSLWTEVKYMLYNIRVAQVESKVLCKPVSFEDKLFQLIGSPSINGLITTPKVFPL